MGPEEEEEMNMASSSSQQQWQEKVLELTKLLQEQGDPPFLWAVEVGKCLLGAGLQAPSVELGQLLISHLCWSNNGPMLWKYIEQAMGTRLLNSLHILALLTSSNKVKNVLCKRGAGLEENCDVVLVVIQFVGTLILLELWATLCRETLKLPISSSSPPPIYVSLKSTWSRANIRLWHLRLITTATLTCLQNPLGQLELTSTFGI